MSKDVVDYKILKSQNTEILSNLVTQALLDGFVPVGVPFVFNDYINQTLVLLR